MVILLLNEIGALKTSVVVSETPRVSTWSIKAETLGVVKLLI